MVEEDVIALREVGFSDEAILDINQVTAYYAYVNRLADGLGVELEPIWSEAYHRNGLRNGLQNGLQNGPQEGRSDED
jgi:hypothetical protein